MTLTAINLQCEHRDSPLAVENANPILCWQLSSPDRAVSQTAYRILVASSEVLLGDGSGDLWDSGKVASSDTLCITYRGVALSPGRRCFWKVQVWGTESEPSTWSDTRCWEMAPQSMDNLGAQWITLKPASDDERPALAIARWIFSDDPQAQDPDRMVCFRHSFVIPAGRTVCWAVVNVAADGNFTSWINQARYFVAVNGIVHPDWSAQTTVQCPSVWDITPALAAGTNTIALISGAGAGKGVILHCLIALDNGDTLTVATGRDWRTGVSAKGVRDIPPVWSDKGCDDTGWPCSRDLGPFGGGPWEEDSPYRRIDKLVPPACFRKQFTVEKQVAYARLHATAAGIYETRLNGTATGNELLAPGWTDYPRRLAYQTCDVTGSLRVGSNTLTATVADGWYSGSVGLWKTYANLYGFGKAFLCRLVITYVDGTTDVVITDSSWRGTTGPIRYADLFNGETHDRRRDLGGWDASGDDDLPWRDAVCCDPGVGRLEPQSAPPVRVVKELKPRCITPAAPGVWVADMGQNMVGWVRIVLRGAAGTRVRLRHGELLHADGRLFTGNLMRAHCTDTFVLRGDPDGEVCEPHFTLHGFRYVEISGLCAGPTLQDITGVVVASDLPITGLFECSDPMLNRLQSNIVWSQRGNFVAIPTDCPQRSERVGWTGDAQVFARTASFNMDPMLFLKSWLSDLMNHQRADGAIADAVPAKDVGYGNFGWGDAIIIIPWVLYCAGGDRSILESYYPAMCKWIGYLRATSTDFIRAPDGWGDWLSPEPKAPNDVTATAFFAHAADLTARCARAIGRDGEATGYEALFRDVKGAFNAAFVRPDSSIHSDTQTVYALAIHFGLVDPARTAGHFARAIEKTGGRINTGFLGVAYMLPALSRAGLTDVAYRLALSTGYPSWGYSIAHGATTIWERWDGCDPDGPPEKRGALSSLNHYAFGSVGEWLYSMIGGLRFDETTPGYGHVVLHPVPGGNITHATMEYRSVRGLITCSWKLEKGTFTLDATIPAGVTATVRIQGGDPERIFESGVAASLSAGVRLEEQGNGYVAYRVGSGMYSFVSDQGLPIG